MSVLKDVDPSSLSLPEIYEMVSNHFTSLVCPIDESTGTKETTDEELSSVIDLVEMLQMRCNEAALFSKGEEINEHPTSSLKYLFQDYYAAKFHCQWRNVDERAFHLVLAKKHFEAFKKMCLDMKVMDEAEVRELRLEVDEDESDDDEYDTRRGRKKSLGAITADEARMMKINKFKRDAICKKRITSLRQKLSSISKGNNENGEEQIDHETDIREMYILQLQSYFRDTLDELPRILQEVQMLQMMKSMKENTAIVDGSTTSIPSTHFDDKGNGEGISVIRLNKSPDGSIVQTREHVKANVFVPRMSEPSMTLQEFGDLEYARAMERKAKEEQITSEGSGEVLDFKRLHEQGKEDNEGLMDAATDKARGWDEWKEVSSTNWRGAGNKANKRF